MSLTFPDGGRFATGITPYQYRPATAYETTPRLLLEVEIDGIQAEAVMDTGGIYLICSPRIDQLFHLETAEAISGVQSILLRGVFVQGRLYRLSLTILAEEGEDATIETTAFVPEPEEAEPWGDLPGFLGLYSCLERAHFAVDPRTERFYFGPAAEAS